ncbi:12624_t:CDS:2, partial [Cetraspora pellucida]
RMSEQYWLQDGRAHDATTIKIEEPIAPATKPSVMTKISSILLFTNVLNPPPPTPSQLPPPNPFTTLPNPIPIDMFHVR